MRSSWVSKRCGATWRSRNAGEGREHNGRRFQPTLVSARFEQGRDGARAERVPLESAADAWLLARQGCEQLRAELGALLMRFYS